MTPITHLVFHHSASPRDTTVEQIDEWHRARGWSGVGYHAVVTGDGKYHTTRSIWRQGAHAPPNAGRIGVCLVGNNEDPEHGWTEGQRQTARAVIAAWKLLVPGIIVTSHRDLMPGHTACPGGELGDLLHLGGLL